MAMDASPLAKLPPELRNTIYHEVLLQDDTIKLTFKPAKENVKSQVHLRETGRQRQLLALTCTCKPLRRETHDLFFALNSFEIYAPTYSFGSRSGTASIPVHRFLDGVTTLSARSALKSIALNIGLYTPLYTPLCHKRCILGAVKDFKHNLLTAYPCLPLRVRCTIAGGNLNENLHIELNMQNLALSIGSGLEKIRGSQKGTHDDRRLQLPYDTLQMLTKELHACLQQHVGGHEFPAPTARRQ